MNSFSTVILLSNYLTLNFTQALAMERHFAVIFAIISLQQIGESVESRANKCGGKETCRMLRDCPSLLQSELLTAYAISELRERTCGFLGRNPKVCCPVNVVKVEEDVVVPATCGRPGLQQRIFGGDESEIGAYPWIVALGYTEPGLKRLSFACSGSIIDENHVLTAAHCVHPAYLGRRKLAVIYLGVWNTGPDGSCDQGRRTPRCPKAISAGYEEIVVHPHFNVEAELAKDIALIKLNVSLNFNAKNEGLVEPICLPPTSLAVEDLAGKVRVIAAGWGLTHFGNFSSVLMSVELPLVHNDQCREKYGDQFSGNQICAGGELGLGTCIGDSGGPVFMSSNGSPPFIQVGIVSFGQMPCGGHNAPSVYTAVHKYKKWILDNIKG